MPRQEQGGVALNIEGGEDIEGLKKETKALLKERNGFDQELGHACNDFQDSQRDLAAMGDRRYDQNTEEAEILLYSILRFQDRRINKTLDQASDLEKQMTLRASEYVSSLSQIATELVQEKTEEVEAKLDRIMKLFKAMDPETRSEFLDVEKRIAKHLIKLGEQGEAGEVFRPRKNKEKERMQRWSDEHSLGHQF